MLEAGKHCFVEKPLAQSVADAERALAAAQDSGRVLMVGHLLEYHPGVQKLKELADSGELGDRIYYIYGNRLNLGKLRADENALWSLGAHDVSVVLHLAGEEPDGGGGPRRSPTCARASRTSSSAFCASPPGYRAHLHLSWLDPHKERRFTVVGSRRMATFDDMALEGKVTIYDKGFDEDARGYGEYITRSGDIFSPQIPNAEPLRIECEHFVDCIVNGRRPQSDGESGLRVVRVLEQLQRSLDAGAALSGVGDLPRRDRGRRRRARPRTSSSGARAVIHDGARVGAGLAGSALERVVHAGVELGVGLPDRGPGRARQAAAAAPGLERGARASSEPLVLEDGVDRVLRRGPLRRHRRSGARDHRRSDADPRALTHRRRLGGGPRFVRRLRRPASAPASSSRPAST